ncbi:MAG TPA: hypothetical protein VNB90_17255 [Cytophagaceae bacterium]|nr:hypothetical protein [Cytophagaceae bacterium]
MKYLFLVNIFLVFWSKFHRIAEMNNLKEQAAIYYKNKDFQKSVNLYEKLLTEYKETDESVTLNLANSYFSLKRYNSAIDNYKLLVNSKAPTIKSHAYLQLGVIYSSNNKKELGLSYFKEALKAMPENEAARYNFELLKKEQELTLKDITPDKKKENNNGEHQTSATTTEESKKMDNSGNTDNNPSSQSGDESEEEGENNTGGEDEEELENNDSGTKESDALASQRLEEMHMSERQARMILKTMKNSEIQYIQQKPKVVRGKLVPGKPDW